MIQDPKQTLPAPVGVVYNTSMSRPDAALALAALYVSASRRDARVDAVAVTGAGFDAAVFCDIVARFYTGQARPSSNNVLPIGFASDDPSPPSPPMVARAVTRTRGDGEPQYARSIRAVTDTAAPDALLRNAITLSAEVVVVLSAPATWLARSLALAGTPAQYRQRVKRVVIVDAGDLDRDRAALAALTAALPSPPIVCGREIGDALKVPGSRLTGALTWTAANPVADAVTATADEPVALHDVAALHYALHPDAGFFSVSAGRLAIDPASTDACRDALVALATAKPAPAQTGRRGG
jgi:hypothetical protein